MIVGIGSDLCNIERIQKSVDRFGDRFLNRVFTETERAKAARRPFTMAGTLAKRFAAKEAFSKAMGTGFRYPVTLQCISVVQDRRGKPGFEFHPRLAQLVAAEGIIGHFVTISDEKSLTCACVVLEKQ